VGSLWIAVLGCQGWYMVSLLSPGIGFIKGKSGLTPRFEDNNQVFQQSTFPKLIHCPFNPLATP